MFLQIQSKDTIKNIATNNNDINEAMLYIIIGLILFSLFIYFILKPKRPDSHKIASFIPRDTRNKNALTSEKKVNKDAEKSSTIFIPEKIIEADKIVNKPMPVAKKNDELPTSIPEVIISEEEQSKAKYIGYNPINLFAQTEPLSFPYVIMPPANCVIKFPRKGRKGRKGFKEVAFKAYIDKYFTSTTQIFDDRFVLTKNSSNPYEPDFVLIDEKEDINIFLDIEIDEPYEGTNDILNRKTTHFQYSDTNRNNALKNRGWIIIHFAEIQVHQQPESCCKLIADVLKSINNNYIIPERLQYVNNIKLVPQWTEETAKQWSVNKYREQYLGIDSFGITANNLLLIGTEETDLGESIEKQIIDDEIQQIESPVKILNDFHKIFMAASFGKYVSFSIDNKKIIFKPININDHEVTGFCYIKNEVMTYLIKTIKDVEIKNNYYTIRVAGPAIGLDKISNIVNTAIQYEKHIRMKYTRSSWQSMLADIETGELILNRIEAEESTRTVSNVQLAINALSENHIDTYRLNTNYLTAYCNKREEQRTFRFDRIGEIEILDL